MTTCHIPEERKRKYLKACTVRLYRCDLLVLIGRESGSDGMYMCATSLAGMTCDTNYVLQGAQPKCTNGTLSGSPTCNWGE